MPEGGPARAPGSWLPAASRVAGARVTWTWAALSALTGVSWALAATRHVTPGTALTIVVPAIAAVKALPALLMNGLHRGPQR
jgi:hypothetical protein